MTVEGALNAVFEVVRFVGLQDTSKIVPPNPYQTSFATPSLKGPAWFAIGWRHDTPTQANSGEANF